MKHILTDIMGTTTPRSVVRALFQDFQENGSFYIDRSGKSGTLDCVNRIREETGIQNNNELIDYVLEQIQKRNLKPEYLDLLGAVNTESYDSGKLQGEFFDDVPVAFEKWNKNGKGIFIYSNRSEEFQSTMFRASIKGDLTPYITGFFDTSEIGSKYSADSYKKIGDIIQASTSDILYLSDLEGELDAADIAGCDVKLVIRQGNMPIENPYRYEKVKSFNEISVF